MRLFIAVDLSSDLRDSLKAQISHLKSIVGSGPIRWINPEAVHLTLKFLGEVPQRQIEEISSVLTRIAAQHLAFTFHVGTFGCFPNWRRPNVFWVGIREPSGKLERLRNRIEEEFQHLGYPREDRAFRPHLTIGRTRKGRDSVESLERISQLEKVQMDQVGGQAASDFFLFRSELLPGGAVYTKLARYSLGKSE